MDAPPRPSTLALCSAPERLVLRLRAKRRVRWHSNVVDNEELCRKKSKCCCLYHAPRTTDQPPEDEDGEGEGLQEPQPPDNSQNESPGPTS